MQNSPCKNTALSQSNITSRSNDTFLKFVHKFGEDCSRNKDRKYMTRHEVGGKHNRTCRKIRKRKTYL